MSSFTDIVAQKAKAIIAGGALLVVGIAEWAVTDPTVGTTISHYIPAPYSQFVPGLLGVIGAWLVHHVPNAVPTAVTVDEPTTDTTILKLSKVNSGEFTGTPAH